MRRGNGWCFGLHPDVIQDVPDVGAYDKAADAHLADAERAQQREHLVDAGSQRRVGCAAAATPAALGRLPAARPAG